MRCSRRNPQRVLATRWTRIERRFTETDIRNASPTTLVGTGQKTDTVFQTLHCVGKDRIDDHVIGSYAST